MSETITPAPITGDNSSSKPGKGRRSDYDQALANDISETGALIEAALEDEAVLAVLSYTQEELEEGLALKTAAQKAFEARQTAQGVAGTKKAARDELLEGVMDDFTAFRTTVQNSLPPEARTPLGASGVVPTDLQKRITLMLGGYTTAQKADFAPALAKRKLTTAIFVARVKQVEQLEKLVKGFSTAEKGATAATKARDTAGEAMRKWAAKFRKQAKSDLRHHPELKAKLGL